MIETKHTFCFVELANVAHAKPRSSVICRSKITFCVAKFVSHQPNALFNSSPVVWLTFVPNVGEAEVSREVVINVGDPILRLFVADPVGMLGAVCHIDQFSVL